MNRLSRLRVWWIPQIPMKSFNVEVDSVSEAVKIMHTLAQYDLFQYKNRVKGDYSNAGGLNIWDEDEQDWLDWYIDFDVTIKGQRYCEYFDEPSDFIQFLNDSELTEQVIYDAMSSE